MGRNYPLGLGVDPDGMLSREIDDHINSKIYSMLGTCTTEELLKYQLTIAQKSVLLLQNEIANLRGKLDVQVSKHKTEVNELQFQLEMQTIKYKKAKDEASLNARALKRCIATHQQLREEIQRDMAAESLVEQGNQMEEFIEEAQTIIPTELSSNKKYQMQELQEDMQMSTTTELSPKQRCHPMDELRPIKYPKYQLSQDTNKFSGNHMKNIYADGARTMKLVNVKGKRHEDGERQYKWVDGRLGSTKKRLLQELDPNIDDLSYRLSMPEDADEV